MAQMIRAILFASAIATSIRGFLANILPNHEFSVTDLRPKQFNRDMAPIISNRPISSCPAFETRPSRCFPPEECCLGTSPSQAAKSLPQEKLSMAGAKASIARAVSGPTPGIVCMLLIVSVVAASCFAFLS